jgi:hypothetical protein
VSIHGECTVRVFSQSLLQLRDDIPSPLAFGEVVGFGLREGGQERLSLNEIIVRCPSEPRAIGVVAAFAGGAMTCDGG